MASCSDTHKTFPSAEKISVIASACDLAEKCFTSTLFYFKCQAPGGMKELMKEDSLTRGCEAHSGLLRNARNVTNIEREKSAGARLK
jgi:hypothetical protein